MQKNLFDGDQFDIKLQSGVGRDDATRTALEAATFRRLLHHLMQDRPEVQNIDLMNLSGFCRNCLSKWLRAEAEAQGLPLTDAAARQQVYGMPYEDWKAAHQKP